MVSGRWASVLLVTVLMLTGCATSTPEDKARAVVAKYGPICEAEGAKTNQQMKDCIMRKAYPAYGASKARAEGWMDQCEALYGPFGEEKLGTLNKATRACFADKGEEYMRLVNATEGSATLAPPPLPPREINCYTYGNRTQCR